MMSPEFWGELARKPRPAPAPVYDPGYCKTAYTVRVPAGDFRTDYDRQIPEHEVKAAVLRVQRSRAAAPFCPYTNTLAALQWRKTWDGRCEAHWFCVACARKARIDPPGLWIAAP